MTIGIIDGRAASRRDDKRMIKREIPLTGVAVMIIKDGKVLLGRRKNAHGAGEYAFPGGHLDHLESFEECARREVREECGLEIDTPQFQFLANVLAYRPKHYVHVGLVAEWIAGEPSNNEPKLNESWQWYSPDALPQPLFEPTRLAFEHLRTGQIYFDLSLKKPVKRR